MKPKKRPGSLSIISLFLAGMFLLLWLVSMFCLTFSVAQTMFDIFVEDSKRFPEYAGNWLEYYYDDELPNKESSTPGWLEHGMLEMLDYTGRASWLSQSSLYESENGLGISLLRNVEIPIQTALIFEDMDGNVIHSNKDFLSFGYVTQETYDQEGPDASWDGYAWVDLGAPDDPRYQILRRDFPSGRTLWPDYEYVRFTGIMDGNRMEPLEMSIISRDDWAYALSESESKNGHFNPDGFFVPQYNRTLPELTKRGYLNWTTLFDNTPTAEEQELVTIYANRITISIYDSGTPVGPWTNTAYLANYGQTHTALVQTTPQETEYANLLDLLNTMRLTSGDDSWRTYDAFRQLRIDDLIILRNSLYRLDYRSEPHSQFDFTVYFAYRVSPLGTAISLLRNVYIVTFVLFLACFLFLRSRIKHHLILPIQLVNENIEKGLTNIHEYRENKPLWREPHALYQNYCNTQSTLQIRQTEITRLKTALDYAKTAEQNRRQMTSNIAHELKTPLAVIHSYAEGLKEHIAEEKRDKYIDVILSEAERTDSMVLEMLDLSRLEAGKVKLARDEFSLADLTKSVFEKLEIAAQGKELRIDYEFPAEYTIVADENRIGQVIENFATNAVKYTPAGGHITVRIKNSRPQATFSIENDSPPLSPEALSKVWDTFYRTDESRSGGGTGLGLAIAKNIVELHGGKCSVRNTQTGVEFEFTI